MREWAWAWVYDAPVSWGYNLDTMGAVSGLGINYSISNTLNDQHRSKSLDYLRWAIVSLIASSEIEEDACKEGLNTAVNIKNYHIRQ